MMNFIKNSRHLTIAYILLFLSILWLNLLYGERIPIEHHLGFDGEKYGNIAIHLEELLLSKSLNGYIIHRILPSSLIWFFFKLSGTPASLSDIPIAFAILNGVLISASILLWLSIAKHHAWQHNLKLLSLILLFVSFAIFKMSAYYPVLTDIPAFFLGTLLCYGVVKKQTIWIWISALLSLFTFPSNVAPAFIFLVLTQRVFLLESLWRKNPTLFSTLITLSLGMISIVFYHRFHHASLYVSPLGKINYLPMTILSLISSMILFFLGLRTLLVSSLDSHTNQKFQFKNIVHPIKMAIILFSLFLISSLITHPFIKNTNPLSTLEFIDHLTTQSLAYPLIHWVSHTIYYGTLIPLLILFWKPVTQCAKSLGTPFLFFLLFSLCLSIGSESRQFINLIPLLVFLLIQTFDELSISITKLSLCLLFGMNFFICKIWLSLNHGEWQSIAALDHDVLLSVHAPMQWYFMQQGPWMSHTAYIMNAIFTLTIFVILYFHFHPKQSSST